MAGAAKHGIGCGWTAAGIGLACLLLSGCADAPTPPPKQPAPMVTPQSPPSSPEFNAKIAKPLVAPEPPNLWTLAIPASPGPLTEMAPLAIPEPLSLSAAPVAEPGLPPQIARPIPRPTGTPQPLPAEIAPPAATASAGSPAPPESDEVGVAGGFRLVFSRGTAELPAAAAALLREIAETMSQEPRMRLKVAAYASGEVENPVPARRLSLQRALKVREALAGEGIASLRVDILALGLTAAAPPNDRVDLIPIR